MATLTRPGGVSRQVSTMLLITTRGTAGRIFQKFVLEAELCSLEHLCVPFESNRTVSTTEVADKVVLIPLLSRCGFSNLAKAQTASLDSQMRKTSYVRWPMWQESICKSRKKNKQV
eukprot:scaffold1837_cov124-Skeletonema_menzelii.AAC.10